MHNNNNKPYFNFLGKVVKDHFFSRRHRPLVKGLSKSFIFKSGDIVKAIYFRKGYSYVFEGICLGIKRKAFIMPNTTFFLRNVILGVSIEMIFSYFSHRLYFLKLQDYKRKFNTINRNKLFLLRSQSRKKSQIK